MFDKGTAIWFAEENNSPLRMLLRLSIVVLRSWPSQQVFATKFGKNKAFARKTAACEIRNTFAIAIATACAANTGYAELVLWMSTHFARNENSRMMGNMRYTSNWNVNDDYKSVDKVALKYEIRWILM